ncbi:hypothetical protein EG346_17035 [Chryseobacterium carnipullorum]|uniref:Uncharacterized protein n=1 Tax=Chryseobacterium carnipullorum TaxID=1124835 RepID=A0A376DUA1_CHRCU|nr:hypothetical protein EG346_17035 [Chryseobacterium carnipullorum]AZA64671.1 hypothetical protein EG345_08065 [Chryseobacterium carnipullorum]STC95698.1 Uncharacterised protein [Chryseobacterium carnipullorum]
MINLNEKVQEIESNISKLKKTAEKHLNNNDYHKYKIICDTILQNEKTLAQFRRELQNTRKRCLTVQ